jgi:hypothetical protein
MDKPGERNSPLAAGMTVNTPANLRAVLRLGCAFVLRGFTNITRFAGGDIRSALVFQALWTANVRPITQSAANETYGSWDSLPPEEMIRPIAVHALSESLLIPYETTRRHVERLIAEGLCVRDKRGVRIAMASIMARPDLLQTFSGGLPNLIRFLDELRAVQFDFAPYRQLLPVTVPLPEDGSLPSNARALLRVVGEYVMHCVDTHGRLYANDFVTGLVHVAIWIANVEQIRQGPANLEYGGLLDVPPDHLRQPISVNALSTLLCMPFETTRRHANKLIREGLVVRTDKGLIVPRVVFENPRQLESAQAIHAHTVRLIADMHRAGFDFSKY